MKKVFSFFSFAALLMLSFAFTPAEAAPAEESVVDCSGKIFTCAILPAASVVITYDIVIQGTTTSVFSGTVSCDGDFIPNLPTGDYDVIVTSSSQAYAIVRGSFCGGAVNINGSGQVPAGTPTLITSFFVF